MMKTKFFKSVGVLGAALVISGVASAAIIETTASCSPYVNAGDYVFDETGTVCTLIDNSVDPAFSTPEIAKFNWSENDTAFVLDRGTADAISFGIVALDDESEPTGFDWTSKIGVNYIVVKAGRTQAIIKLAMESFSGTVSDFGSPAISNVAFFNGGDDTTTQVPEPSVIGLLALGLLGMGAMARRRRSQGQAA